MNADVVMWWNTLREKINVFPAISGCEIKRNISFARSISFTQLKTFGEHLFRGSNVSGSFLIEDTASIFEWKIY